MRPESRRIMRESGFVVWLTDKPETIQARMASDSTTAGRRPSLTSRGELDEIIHLLEKRESIYRETAHHQVDTEDKSPEDLACAILGALELQTDGGGVQ